MNFQTFEQMVFLLSLKQIASIKSTSTIADSFKTEYFKLVLGTLSLPINLPGTNYYRGFQV
jgi:brassinosteroid-6-oxidase 1